MKDVPLKQIFEYARLRRWLNSDQFPPIKSPDRVEKARNAFDPETDHLERLLDCVETRIDAEHINAPGKRRQPMDERVRRQRKVFRVFVHLLLMTGVRPGEETRPLKWKHLETDFRGQKIEAGSELEIRTFLGVRSSKPRAGEEKTRLVPVPEQLMAILNQWRTDPDNHFSKESCYILSAPDGEPVKSFNSQFRHVLKECGLTKAQCGVQYEPYSLRHTFATINLAAGISSWVVAKSMGHTDILTHGTERCFGKEKL